MEALIVILIIIIIALVVLCLKFSKESKPKSEQIVIEVCQREDKIYYAQIRGRSEIYATGNTFYDAVGELVNSNREIFKVEYLGAIPLQREKLIPD